MKEGTQGQTSRTARKENTDASYC